MLKPSGFTDVEKIAEGQKTVIYSALRVDDHQSVILKTIRERHPSQDDLALMYHEYEVTKDLQLPGIVKTLGLIEEKDTLVLVEEDIHGVSFKEYLKKKHIQDLNEFFDFAVQMSLIVEDLHRHQIIHKDIKPSNFILEPKTKTLKITDFNYAAKLIHEVQDIVAPEKLEGTLAYMAPEQTGRMNVNIDYRSDFYSLGVTFFEMLTGKLPFPSTDPLEVIHGHLSLSPPDVSEINNKVPKILAALVQKLMAKMLNDRYQSAVGIKRDLLQMQQQWQETKTLKHFLLGSKDVIDRLNISQKIYGREGEVKHLQNAYQRVREGEVLPLMVCGYSGIGKTKLVNEVHKSMVKDKGYFITGKFDQLERSTPYAAITQAFNQLARHFLTESEERFEQIKQAIKEAVGNVGQLIIDLAADFELILGKQPPLPLLPPQETENRLMIVFQKFLRKITGGGHPLVLFIDDLQWIDSGSLKLFEFILNDTELTHVLLLGAYRDNEVDDYHPLIRFFKNGEQKRRAPEILMLKPLSKESFEQLLSDSLSCPIETMRPLVELIHSRTQGNPFFFNQVVTTLYQKKLLYYSYTDKMWKWKEEEVKALGITDNVVDLMLGKLKALPKNTQSLLKYAACVGNRFTIDTLHIISGNLPEVIGKTLWPAMEQELIFTLRLGYKRVDAFQRKDLRDLLSKDITYQFVHDKVQQAIYQDIEEKKKQEVHLAIARLLMEKEPEACKRERLFEVADHFNKSHDLLNASEIDRVVELNYQAGVKAKKANAYKPMHTYLSCGLKLTDPSWWETNEKLFFNIKKEYAISLYVTGEHVAALAELEKLFDHSSNPFDKAAICHILLGMFQAKGELNKGASYAAKALNYLKVKVKTNPSKFDVFVELLKSFWLLRKYDINNLDRELPVVEDSKIELATQILKDSSLLFSLRSVEGRIYIILIQMNLMLKHGRTNISSATVMNFAMLMMVAFRHVKKSKTFSDVALRLIDENADKDSAGYAYWVYFEMLNFMHAHYRENIPIFHRALQLHQEAGNIYYVGIDENCFIFNMLCVGKSLKEPLEFSEKSLEDFTFSNTRNAALLVEYQIQVFKNLSSQEECDEKQMEIVSSEVEASEEHLIILILLKLKGFYHYFLENYAESESSLSRCFEKWQETAFQLFSFECETFYALSLLKLMSQVPLIKKWNFRKKFKKTIGHLKFAAQACPENFRHQYLVILGEEAKQKRLYAKADRYFNQAIENAKLGDFYLWVALANELIGEMYYEINPRTAIDYILESHYYYHRYGMMKKAVGLKKRFPNCFIQREEIDSSLGAAAGISTPSTTPSTLDFMSVIKASQTLAGEIDLSNLLKKMLTILTENAGAERTVFIEKRKPGWFAIAEMKVSKEQVSFKEMYTVLEDSHSIAKKIVQYAIRTREPVVVKEALKDPKFSKDEYIIATKPKSILCVPVIHHDALVGIIYLENNLTVDAFSKDRVTVIRTLSSQVAISLENSRFVDKMKRLFQKAEKFVPRQFLELLHKQNIEEVELGDCEKREITVLCNDIRSFTTIVENMTPDEAFALINRYWEFIAPVVRKHHGYIDQFLGDAILAIFPDQPNDAVLAAVEMMQNLKSFNKKQSEKGDITIDMGIGISTGEAMLGIVGEHERHSSSLISDAANTSARVEGLNKFYKTKILLSDETYNKLAPEEASHVRLIDKVRLVGKKQITHLYEVIEWESELKQIRLSEYLTLFDEAFSHYTSGAFVEARNGFQQCLTYRPKDPVVTILLERMSELDQTVKAGKWNGVYVHKYK